jgi:hypothetical protein
MALAQQLASGTTPVIATGSTTIYTVPAGYIFALCYIDLQVSTAAITAGLITLEDTITGITFTRLGVQRMAINISLAQPILYAAGDTIQLVGGLTLLPSPTTVSWSLGGYIQ